MLALEPLIFSQEKNDQNELGPPFNNIAANAITPAKTNKEKNSKIILTVLSSSITFHLT